jgi:CDP-6-deoxy-D-xylo-4-hexulose-3-dehydrase
MIALQSQPFVAPDEMRRRLVEFVGSADRFTCGPNVAEFERLFAAWQGRKHAVCVNSGSSANLALIQAELNLSRLKPGDTVAYSALTWATNVMPLLQLGLDPVAVDIDLRTLNVGPVQLARVYDEKPFRALFLTHALGFCGDVRGVADWCADHNVLLLEDACEALGSEASYRKLGSWGEAATFSFFVGHHLSTIEGGMVATDDLALAEVLRMVRSHGWSRELPDERRAALDELGQIPAWRSAYTFWCPAFNLRPTEITGVLGVGQMSHVAEVVDGRERNFLALAEAARSNDQIFPLELEMDKVSAFAFPVVARSDSAFRALAERFAAEVEIRPMIGGSMPEQPIIKNTPRYRECPSARVVHERGFYFPCRHDLSADEIATLCKLLEAK